MLLCILRGWYQLASNPYGTAAQATDWAQEEYSFLKKKPYPLVQSVANQVKCASYSCYLMIPPPLAAALLRNWLVVQSEACVHSTTMPCLGTSRMRELYYCGTVTSAAKSDGSSGSFGAEQRSSPTTKTRQSSVRGPTVQCYAAEWRWPGNQAKQ